MGECDLTHGLPDAGIAVSAVNEAIRAKLDEKFQEMANGWMDWVGAVYAPEQARQPLPK